jgi:hypothetical protein
MTGRDLTLRLASTLIRRACLHLPTSARDERQQEWAAELPAILDDPAIRSRIRRYTRAVRFAAGQRQAVRCITDPSWPQWLGMAAIRAAASAAVAAVALTVAALALSPAADHAPSDSSPIAVTDIALFLLAVLAGLICITLLVGLALVRAIRRRWRWHRPRRLADARVGSGDRWARWPQQRRAPADRNRRPGPAAAGHRAGGGRRLPRCRHLLHRFSRGRDNL